MRLASSGRIVGNVAGLTPQGDNVNASQQFFFAHAGYSWNPLTETPAQGKRRMARVLARAEKRGTDAGLSFEWQIDDSIDSSDFDDSAEPWQLWQVTCRDASGAIVDAMGGVDFGRDGSPWSDPYRRVLEAEMACGVMK